MGLLDILNGMQNGPSGPSQASAPGSGGMSPLTMAILGLLAWKAVKHFSAGQQPSAGRASPSLPDSGNAGLPQGGNPGGGIGGGLGDLLKGGLGGLLAGGAAGSLISGGLGDLLHQLQQSGHGETANSWVGNGQNAPISPGDLGRALGADQIEGLMSQTGLSRDELLGGLSEHLPGIIDHLTPDGRLPSESEVADRI